MAQYCEIQHSQQATDELKENPLEVNLDMVAGVQFEVLIPKPQAREIYTLFCHIMLSIFLRNLGIRKIQEN